MRMAKFVSLSLIYSCLFSLGLTTSPCTNNAVVYSVGTNTEFTYTKYCCTKFIICWHRCTKTQTYTTYFTQAHAIEKCCSGYGGDNCLPICNPSCGTNMKCTSPNTCDCVEGWKGRDCSTPICNPSCGSNMECLSPNTCTCIDGWKGDDCSTAICNPSCGSNMECLSPNTCTCIDGWKGDDCSTAICNPSCGSNMECLSPNTCTCIDGWEGDDCLIDINECLDGTDTCENGCQNTNGSYSCFCDDDELIANNERNCLGGIINTAATPGVDNITLLWSPPTNHSNDGILIGYTLTCNNNTLEEYVLFPFCNHTFTELLPFTNYNCCIEPKWNENGVGPTICIESTTMEDAPSDPPRNVSISTVDSESALVQWTPPTIPNGIISHFSIYINKTNMITAVIVDGVSTHYMIEDLHPYQLVGVSLSAATSGGEGPISSYVHNRSAETEPGPIHNFEVNITSNDSASISWHPPINLNGIITSYHILVKMLTDDRKLVIGEWELESEDTEHIIEDLEPFVPYEVDVVAATKIGKGDIIHKIFFTEETVPSSAPIWCTTQRSSASEIQLGWNPLSLEQARGNMTGYTVRYGQSVNNCTTVCSISEIFVGHNEPYSLFLNDLNPQDDYCVAIVASTTAGVGVYSEWTQISVYERKDIFFYIIGVQNCEYVMDLEPNNDRFSTFITNIVFVIYNSCNCSITTEYMYSNFVNCSGRMAVLKVTIILPKEQYGDMMFNIVERWINSSNITIITDSMVIQRACEDEPTCLPVETDPTIRTTAKTSSSNLVIALIALFVTVSTTLAILIAIIGISKLVIVLRKHWSNYETNRDTKPIEKYERYTEMKLSSVNESDMKYEHIYETIDLKITEDAGKNIYKSETSVQYK